MGEAAGRTAPARVTALRTLERMSREDRQPDPEPEPRERGYPVDERGAF
jgi:hypothetical protein